MHFVNPFAQPGHWFKGNLHLHTTVSDGDLTPDEVVDWYRTRGYHFLALTDHGIPSEAREVSEDFITLSGIEVDGVDSESGLYHLVGLGLAGPPRVRSRETMSLQNAVSRLHATARMVLMAHPYWSGQMSKDLLPVEGCIALEVYNGGCEVEDGKGFSTVHWDDLLAAGSRLWGVAVDDAHWRGGDHDAGLGWVWVKAAELTETAILDALQQGHFYASTGAEIYSLELEGDRLHVSCSPAASVDFVGSGYYSRRVAAAPGETLTEASYRLRKGQRYVRVACRDVRDSWAWSNPIYLEE
ncbi:MAG: CehA/McbA family metallohydrolase [Anaerolineae bacterium]|jgi:hypothetical protein